MLKKTRFWVLVAIFSLLLPGSIAQAGAKGGVRSGGGCKSVIKGSQASSKPRSVRTSKPINGRSWGTSKKKSVIMR